MTEVINIMQAGMTGLILILIGLIKIPPLKINLWGFLGKKIGKVINGEVLEKVGGLNQELDRIRKEHELERVRQARQRILRFSDEILFHTRHSKEHFDEILEDIDLYEKYCREHKEYKNNRAVLAIATIRDVYKQCLETHDFLSYSKQG